MMHSTLLVAQLLSANSACSSEAHRAFDFWLGRWEVYAEEKLIAHSEISLTASGCAIREQYQTLGSFGGESLNAYDANRGTWHQTWVDNSGVVLLLEGEFKAGQMQLRGEGLRSVTASSGSKPVLQKYRQRISWRVRADASVSQIWQVQAKDGKWQAIFDGVYRKRTESSSDQAIQAEKH